ncbi:MAG TPA: hypothetical protein VJT82_03440 [Pyrinomonadaceae bacterium]|nr:hypothetical protein [Pyrinomonadaceae bacterium]
MKLKPDAVLKRRPYVRLSINSGDEVQISAGGKLTKCGLHGLTILELFSRPLPLADGIKQLGARVGADERVAAIATIFRLYEGGVLRDVARGEAAAGDSNATTNGDSPDGSFARESFARESSADESFFADEIYFECPLDAPASDLIPYRDRAAETLDARRLAELTLNPNIALQTSETPPAHLASRLAFLDRFSPQRPILWVEDAGTNALAPYWLEKETLESLERLRAGSLTPAELEPEVARRFAQAQILVAPESNASRAGEWRRTCDDLRHHLRENQHAVLRKIVAPLQLAALRRYFRALDARGHLRASSNQHYAHNRRSIYDEETSRFVQQQISALAGRITPEPIRPSHTQVSVYQPGAFLRRHKDQPQYVWNLSLVIDAEPEVDLNDAWPICLEVGGRTTEVRLGIGDAVLYRGSELTHWRDVLPADESVTLLFCFFSPAAEAQEPVDTPARSVPQFPLNKYAI